ncbi:glycosyltransferase [Spiribacter roseus]|uniref:Glycosyltransferase n=1 Tax=Spiribacter roseus TaxID=1855875 RepID=A0ABV3S032_9GAMM
MPTFNSAQYLQDSIASLNRQTSQDYELLLCDAGSTDESVDLVLNSLGRKARLVSDNDTGVPDALNKGFNHSRGDVLCWLNSDDIIVCPATIESILRRYSEKQFDVLVADNVSLDPEGRISKTQYAFVSKEKNLDYSGNIFTGSLFFSQSAWGAFPGFSSRFKYAFEYELTDFLFQEYRAQKLDLIAGGFRHNPEGLSKVFRQELAKELEVIRGNRNSPSRERYLFERIKLHSGDGCLWRSLANKLIDRNRGKRWDDLSVK